MTVLAWVKAESPARGDLRVWYSRNNVMYFCSVGTVERAKEFIAIQIGRDLLDEGVTMNAFGLEIFAEWAAENGGWGEWYDEDGNDISDAPMSGEELDRFCGGVNTDN